MKKLITNALAALVLLFAVIGTAHAAGPMVEGWMITSGGFGSFRMSIPDNNPQGGISHDLNPADWMRFRVRVTHDDSTQIAFASDSFAPVAGNIQLCTQEGCEALPIDLGNEQLDWNDTSKVHVYLEVKECALCSWTAFDVETP